MSYLGWNSCGEITSLYFCIYLYISKSSLLAFAISCLWLHDSEKVQKDLQFAIFCFYLCFTQRSNFIGIGVVKGSSYTVPVLEFPASSAVLRRRKREWVIPPIRTPENDRGPFPKHIEAKMVYSISGEGADLDPKGLFTVNRNNGSLYVTRALDREAKDKYVENLSCLYLTWFIIVVFMTVTATDADDPNTDNADIRYSILSQSPQEPVPAMFTINPVTGVIRVNTAGLDREVIIITHTFPKPLILLGCRDMQGEGRVGTGTAVITVTDSNDKAPKFEKTSYSVSIPENKVGAVVVKMPVTYGDEPQSPAWTAKFRIINGNSGGCFAVNTGPSKQEGIITTVKPLDFEQNSKFTLLVVAENDVPFAKPLTTSTTAVTVNVLDVNEAPVFDPEEQIISKPEDVAVGSELTVYTATDPDTARTQKVTYRVGSDPAGWVSVDGETGLVKVSSPMDRESPFVKDDIYKALILAMDDDPVPATGTGTLVIELKDVNDNAPTIEEREIRVCNKQSAPVLLSVMDEDGPGFAAPYRVELLGDKIWCFFGVETGIRLTLKTALQQGDYSIDLRVYDNLSFYQDSTILASVCDCTGDKVHCPPQSLSPDLVYYCTAE
uniref:Cadherin domain-containing protein n=1 Tax=Pygocentrus nattereri TaxID=42514 RepID=A0A3B4DY46_PYGNA